MANAADRTVVRNLDLSDLSHVVSFATLVRNRERRRKRQQAASERIARLQLLIAEATREVASLLAESTAEQDGQDDPEPPAAA